MSAMELLQAASNRLYGTLETQSFETLNQFFSDNPQCLEDFLTGKVRIVNTKNKWIIVPISTSLPDSLISLNNCA